MNGKKSLLAIILTTFSLWAISPDKTLHEIKDLVLQQKYEDAHKKSREILDYNTNRYALLFVENSKMVDYESYAVDGETFENRAEEYLKKVKKQKLNSDEKIYFHAMIKGMKGMSTIKRGKALPGAMESRSSSKTLEKLLKKYPDDVSLLQSVGLSKYYMATSLSWLPIAGGKPEEGFTLLNKALTINALDRYLTMQSMIWVYIDEKEYSKAIETAQKVLQKYPANSLAMRGLMQAYKKAGQKSDAIAIAHSLEMHAISRTPVNRADQLSALRTQIECTTSDSLKIKLCTKALSIPLSPKEKQIEWVQKHRKSIAKIEKDLQ